MKPKNSKDQKLSEAEEKEYLARIDYLSRYANDFIILLDDKFYFLETNKRVEEVYGYSHDELMKMKATDLRPPELRGLFLRQIDDAIKHGHALFETIHQKKDGSQFPVEINLHSIDIDGKRLYQAVIRDISARKRAEEALKQSEIRFRGFFENSMVGIFESTLEGKLTYVNSAFARILGYFSPEEMIESITNIVEQLFADPCQREGIKLWIQEKGKVENFEALLIKKDGSKIWASIYAILSKADDGKINYQGTIVDITERKRAEKLIEDSLQATKESAEALKAAVKAKSSFTAMVSHELRTPLAALRESTSQLLEGILGPINQEQKEYLEIAKRNIDRLNRLINEVLDFQRLEAGKMVFNMQDNDINEIVKECEKSMAIIAKNKKLDLVVSLNMNLPKVKFDHDKICQVIINLVNNALKGTEKGGITISTIQKDGFAEVSIKDTGIGIKSEDLPRLFQQYEQITRKAGGTGLGLAICRELVEAQGGKIWAESIFGQGTTMHFTLPVS